MVVKRVNQVDVFFIKTFITIVNMVILRRTWIDIGLAGLNRDGYVIHKVASAIYVYCRAKPKCSICLLYK